MKLMTKEIKNKIPAMRATEGKPESEIMVKVKFFCPWNHWTWYATEFDGKSEFWGLVSGDVDELGYFNLKELESTKVMGLGIERDMYFQEKSLAEIRKEIKAKYND